MLGEPEFPFGLAEGDQQEIRTGRLDVGNDLAAPFTHEGTGRRTCCPDDPEPGIEGLELPSRLVGDSFGTTEEVDASTEPSGMFAEVVNQIRARHSLREPRPTSTPGPDQRGAVGQEEGRLVVDPSHFGTLGGQHRIVDVGRDEERRPTHLDQPHHRLGRLVSSHRREWEPPDPGRAGHRGPSG